MATSYANNTVTQTACASAAKDRPFGLTGTGLEPINFLAGVLDSLDRASVGPLTSTINMCDALNAYRSMTCSMINRSLPGDLDEQSLMAQIAYKLMVALPS